MKSDSEMAAAIEKYASTVKRVCFIHLKNAADTEDVCQNVFLKYALHEAPFENDSHEKAWILRVALNESKDLLKNFFRSHTVSLPDYIKEEGVTQPEQSQTLEAVLALPEKYRRTVFLYYYEGYNAKEIASMLDTTPNTIYTQLARAKEKLKDILGGEVYE